jgi:hypothetical protein
MSPCLRPRPALAAVFILVALSGPARAEHWVTTAVLEANIYPFLKAVVEVQDASLPTLQLEGNVDFVVRRDAVLWTSGEDPMGPPAAEAVSPDWVPWFDPGKAFLELTFTVLPAYL